MTTTVHIYLPVQAEGVAPETEFIHALSIPLQDIKRFAIRPLKWLRFATFTVCGAKGDLSATRGGERADYENVTFDSIADEYYYKPDSLYHLVDLEAFNERITPSVATSRRSGFRRDICNRDDACVFTGDEREICDATHIIPCSKGDDYITHVVHDRSSLYEKLPFRPPGGSVDINCVQNGILLRKDLHASFGNAIIVFLRTPNFAMEPTDVPWIEEGPIPHTRTTLQHMKPRAGRHPVPQWDAQADWSDESAPPSILLDFMYGAAVVKHWKRDGLRDRLDRRHKDDFSKIPKYPRYLASEGDEDDTENSEQGDGSSGSEWSPAAKGKHKARKTFSSDASAALLEAMDDVLYLSMLVRGPTPQWMIAEREKREKEDEVRSQEHSVEKVQQWLDSSRVP